MICRHGVRIFHGLCRGIAANCKRWQARWTSRDGTFFFAAPCLRGHAKDTAEQQGYRRYTSGT